MSNDLTPENLPRPQQAQQDMQDELRQEEQAAEFALTEDEAQRAMEFFREEQNLVARERRSQARSESSSCASRASARKGVRRRLGQEIDAHTIAAWMRGSPIGRRISCSISCRV